jgi:hypothetical protein
MGEMDESSERHVIGAAFPDRAAADAAKHELHDRLDVDEEDLELGEPGADATRHGIGAFLAARLRRRPEARAIVEQYKGEVVADVAESRAERPSASTAPDSSGPH